MFPFESTVKHESFDLLYSLNAIELTEE